MSHSNPPPSDENQIEEAIQVTFDSEGSCVRGWFHPAKGAGPFPTAILLHGFPGNDQSPLGLGPALMRAGINALTFNYRGTWGSEGLYTPCTSIADVHSALLYLKSNAGTRGFAVDMTKIALAGYSYGGGIALISALALPQIQKVATIAGGNLCAIARRCAQNDNFKEFFLNYSQEEFRISGVRSPGAEACIHQLQEKLDEYDPVKHVKELVGRDILFIGGWRDQEATLEEHILPIFRALQNNGAEKLRIEILDADHYFKNVRQALAQQVIAWIKG